MPDMDGYEVVKVLREPRHLNADTPIIALTANATPGDKERCLALGIRDYLTKPVDLGVLSEVIERWTRTKQEERAQEQPPLAPSSTSDAPRPARVERVVASALPLDAKRLEESSMGIPALRHALLQTFLSDVRPRLDRLASAIS